jgi:hypothetical protein
MDNLADHQRIGGESVQISDCWVWAEINYLDSPTDYREYLPQNCARSGTIPANDAIVLGSCVFPQRSKVRQWSHCLILLFIFLISWFLLRFPDVW